MEHNNETPLKEGYERKFNEFCGTYYDRPIVGEGYERCDGCKHPFPIGTMCTDGAISFLKHICDDCLKNGKICRCSKCNVFVYGMKEFDNILYCHKCEPPITFYFNINNDKSTESTVIKIPIPNENIASISTNYFFDEIAQKLQVPSDKIHMTGLRRGYMLCPAEYYKLKHRTYQVSVSI